MGIQRVSGAGTSRWALGLLLVLMAFLATCGGEETVSSCTEADCPACPAITCPEPLLYEEVWAASGHADQRAEAFVHWDEEDPPEIPPDCAKCHSRPGYMDFLGVDGTDFGRVDNPAKIGTTVSCFVCHNEVTMDMDRVEFPSGTRISGLGAEARCIQCHQGRASAVDVDQVIAAAGLTDDDATSEELTFVNTHSISGATAFGNEVKGAYEYEGQRYRGHFNRGDEFFSCIRCHNPHSLELDFASCRECHTSARQEPREIRVDSTDYDGDGDMDEGIADEIETLHAALYTAIQDYARQVVGTPLVYDLGAYPYFFIDADRDSQADPDETVFSNQYTAWTPRLLRAAYNYNYVAHDPGAYAHNSDYVLQVLYDSLVDLGADTSKMQRPAVYVD